MRLRAFRIFSRCLLAMAGIAASAAAEPSASQPKPASQAWPAPPPPPLSALGSPSAPTSYAPARTASNFESGMYYTAAAVYGAGLGVWLDAEFRIHDPALLLVPPSLLGVAAPITAYASNHPRLPRGVPGAIAAGLLIGTGEGVSIAGVQMFTSDHPWGLHGLGRAMVIGSTAGGIAGVVVGVGQEPSPNISAFATSGVAWGSLIGSAFGLGTSKAGEGFSLSNDWMARGGLIGFNAGLAITMGLSTAFVPTLGQLSWMWIGGSLGAFASLPVYLFYLRDDGPPAKRGLVFTATATTLGILVGGIFGPSSKSRADATESSSWASLDYVLPMPVPGGGLGLTLGGSLF